MNSWGGPFNHARSVCPKFDRESDGSQGQCLSIRKPFLKGIASLQQPTVYYKLVMLKRPRQSSAAKGYRIGEF